MGQVSGEVRTTVAQIPRLSEIGLQIIEPRLTGLVEVAQLVSSLAQRSFHAAVGVMPVNGFSSDCLNWVSHTSMRSKCTFLHWLENAMYDLSRMT